MAMAVVVVVAVASFHMFAVWSMNTRGTSAVASRRMGVVFRLIALLRCSCFDFVSLTKSMVLLSNSMVLLNKTVDLQFEAMDLPSETNDSLCKKNKSKQYL